METHSDQATEISISEKSCWIIIKKNSLDESWLSDKDQTEENSHRAGIRKANMKRARNSIKANKNLPIAEKNWASIPTQPQLQTKLESKAESKSQSKIKEKKRSIKSKTKLSEEVNLIIELIKYYSGTGDKKKEMYIRSDFLTISIPKTQIWNEMLSKAEKDLFSIDDTNKKLRAVSSQSEKSGSKSLSKKWNEEGKNENLKSNSNIITDTNKGYKRRGPRREEWFHVIKQELDKNKYFASYKIDTNELAESLELLLYEKSRKRVDKHYYDKGEYLRSNIKIVAEYQKIIELLSKKKIPINILINKGHLFRK